MLKYVRTILIGLFCIALLGAAGVYYYVRTHEDYQPPVFHAESDVIELSVADPQEALFQGLSATDDRDGDLTGKIRVKGTTAFTDSANAEFNVSYIVFDSASNYATYTRTARYTDYVSPRFSLAQPMIFGLSETVRFDGTVTVTDQLDGDISGRLKLEESNILNTIPGTYRVLLSATNRMGDTVTLPLTVQITENSRSCPKIELKKYLIYLDVGQKTKYRSYISSVTDPMRKGREDSEEEDEPISVKDVSINYSEVDTSVPGTYEVYYYYTGISGELATVILTVVVE